MAKPGNVLIQLSKKLVALQVKSSKINEEIKALSDSVAAEVKKQESAPAPVEAAKTVPAKAAPGKTPAKTAPAKVAPVKASAAPAGTSSSASSAASSKKRGRPSKK